MPGRPQVPFGRIHLVANSEPVPLLAVARIAICFDELVPVASRAWHGLVWAKALAH